MKQKRDLYKNTISDLKNQVGWANTISHQNQKTIEELRYDLIFLANHVGLQKNQFAAPRYVPTPKPVKPTLYRRLRFLFTGH